MLRLKWRGRFQLSPLHGNSLQHSIVFGKANVVNTRSTREQADISDTVSLPFRQKLESRMTAPLLSLEQQQLHALPEAG